jgi:hypothetical protein
MAALVWAGMGSCLAQTPERLDQEDGFAGIRFGTSGSLVPGLYPVQGLSDGSRAVYSRYNDSLMLGMVPLLAVRYLLMQDLNRWVRGQTDALYEVRLEAAAANAPALLQELTTRYGPGQTVATRQGETGWRWTGQQVVLTYRLVGNRAGQATMPAAVEVSIYRELLRTLANRMPVCGLGPGPPLPRHLPLLKQKQ